jgi:hypothetical protein
LRRFSRPAPWIVGRQCRVRRRATAGAPLPPTAALSTWRIGHAPHVRRLLLLGKWARNPTYMRCTQKSLASSVRDAARASLDVLRELSPDAVEVESGIKFAGELGAIIAKGAPRGALQSQAVLVAGSVSTVGLGTVSRTAVSWQGHPHVIVNSPQLVPSIDAEDGTLLDRPESGLARIGRGVIVGSQIICARTLGLQWTFGEVVCAVELLDTNPGRPESLPKPERFTLESGRARPARLEGGGREIRHGGRRAGPMLRNFARHGGYGGVSWRLTVQRGPRIGLSSASRASWMGISATRALDRSCSTRSPTGKSRPSGCSWARLECYAGRTS